MAGSIIQFSTCDSCPLAKTSVGFLLYTYMYSLYLFVFLPFPFQELFVFAMNIFSFLISVNFLRTQIIFCSSKNELIRNEEGLLTFLLRAELQLSLQKLQHKYKLCSLLFLPRCYALTTFQEICLCESHAVLHPWWQCLQHFRQCFSDL